MGKFIGLILENFTSNVVCCGDELSRSFCIPGIIQYNFKFKVWSQVVKIYRQFQFVQPFISICTTMK